MLRAPREISAAEYNLFFINSRLHIISSLYDGNGAPDLQAIQATKKAIVINKTTIAVNAETK